MTDQEEQRDPECVVCGAILKTEIRERQTWGVVVSGVRGGHREEQRVGWEMQRQFECGATSRRVADSDIWIDEVQCTRAQRYALEYKAKVIEQQKEIAGLLERIERADKAVMGLAIENGATRV